MSYAIRNSLLLFVVLLFLNAAGWGYLYVNQHKTIGELRNKLKKEQKKLLNNKRAINMYDFNYEQYKKVSNKLKNYRKTLPTILTASDVYSFITKRNENRAYIKANYTILDSTIYEKYGVIHSKIEGSGYYSNLYRLLARIENSSSINKIRGLNIEPETSIKQQNKVDFSFRLDSYYDKTTYFKSLKPPPVKEKINRVYNPFFPLIRTIKPNTDHLPDVNKSELVGVSKNIIYIIDQNHEIKSLQVGDKVYLGRLQSIDTKKETATFYLNKGGIIDRKTLEVE